MKGNIDLGQVSDSEAARNSTTHPSLVPPFKKKQCNSFSDISVLLSCMYVIINKATLNGRDSQLDVDDK